MNLNMKTIGKIEQGLTWIVAGSLLIQGVNLALTIYDSSSIIIYSLFLK